MNDILAWNRAGHLPLAGHLDLEAPTRVADRPNQLKLLFLDKHMRDLYVNWEDEAAVAVSSMRYMAAQFPPHDQRLAALVGEVSMNSPEVARLWVGHYVRRAQAGPRGCATRKPAILNSTTRYSTCPRATGNDP